MPRSGWVKPASDRRLSDMVSVGLLTRVFPGDLVDEVIADCGRTEQRSRTLTARVTTYFSIGMALNAEGSYEEVFEQLTDGLSWSSGWSKTWSPPTKSAIFQARSRLGYEPVRELFRPRRDPSCHRRHARVVARRTPNGGHRRHLPRPARHTGERRTFRAAAIEPR